MDEYWRKTKYHRWYQSHERFRFTIKYLLDLYDETCKIEEKIFTPFVSLVKRHITYSESHLYKRFQFTTSNSPVDQVAILAGTDIDKRNFCLYFLERMREEEAILQNYLGTRPKINPGLNSNGE